MTYLLLFLLFITSTICRLHTRSEPLERDITTYAVVAHEMLSGKKLYTDTWDHKPPAVYWFFALAERIVGYGPDQVLLLNIVFNGIVLAGVYFAASSLGRTSGLWAATAWTLVSLNPHLEANQPNTEVFINAFVVWLYALFVRVRRHPPLFRTVLICGFLAALATLFKHHAILPVIGIGIAHIAISRQKMLSAIRVGLQIGIIAACWMAVAGWFAIDGRFNDFFNAVVRHNMAHAGNPLHNLLDSMSHGRIIFLFFGLIPIIAAFSLGKRFRVPATLLLGYSMGVFFEVTSTRWWFPHYFQLWLPVLCIGFGWLIAIVRYRLRSVRGAAQKTHIVLATIVILPILAYQIYFQALPAEAWSRAKYGNVVIECVDQAQEISRILKHHETFFHFGDDSGLYFYTRKNPPTSIVWYYPLYMGPLRDELSSKMLSELKTALPDMVVMLKALPTETERNPVYHWCIEQYKPLPGNNARPRYDLLARIGSDLAARYINEQISTPD